MVHWANVIWSVFGGGALLALSLGVADRISGKYRQQPPAEVPKDPQLHVQLILQERYARGEIDRDEYLERRGYLALEAERLKELPA